MKKEKATLLKGRSKQKKTMNVYFLTKAPKSSTFFVVKSFSKKKIDSVECDEKKLDIYHLRTHMKILTLLFYIYLLI